MKIIIDFLGVHIEMTDGFAWMLIGAIAFLELVAVVSVIEIINGLKR